MSGTYGDYPWKNLDDGDDTTFAHTDNSVYAMMSLDFGEQDCTKVVLKNRTGSDEVANRLNGVRLAALDKDGKQLWDYVFWGTNGLFPVNTFDFDGKVIPNDDKKSK